jgi:hypothetical protein
LAITRLAEYYIGDTDLRAIGEQRSAFSEPNHTHVRQPELLRRERSKSQPPQVGAGTTE